VRSRAILLAATAYGWLKNGGDVAPQGYFGYSRIIFSKNTNIFPSLLLAGFFFFVCKKYRWAPVYHIFGNTDQNTARDLSNEFINLSTICQNSLNFKKLYEYQKNMFGTPSDH
jgi:hypothetical protein